jgi:CRP/FNR family cyclic AMP-dependent transcriptional regulator
MGLLPFARRHAAGTASSEASLRALEIFSKLGDRQLRKLAGLFLRRRYAAGEVLIRKGDTGLGMFLIVSGRVEVFDTRDGNRVRLAVLGPGKSVGEMSLMDERPRSASVEALEETECLLMTRDSFNGLTRREPEILWGIVPLLVERLRLADAQLAELAEVRSAAVAPAPAVAAPALAAPAPDGPTAVAKEEERAKDEDEDEDDEVAGSKDEATMLTSFVQLSAASMMFFSSAFLLATQESLRVFWSRDPIGRSLGKNEEVVSALTSTIEEKMNPESKRLFEAFQDLMNSMTALFKK